MRKLLIVGIWIPLIAACAPPSLFPTPTFTPTFTPTPTATWTPTVAPTPTPTPTSALITYVVQPGDTLARIAARYETTAEAICVFNALSNCSLIYPGQELLIPPEGFTVITPTPSPTLVQTPTWTVTSTPSPTPTPTPSEEARHADGAAHDATPAHAPADPGGLPGGVIPEPFGVNIHFTQPDPGELALLEAAGFRFVRMDLFWHLVEREREQYDFSEYDALVATMAQRGIRIIFVLDYGNDLYGGRGAPHYSEEGQAAFARFAAAAARRYRHKGVIWEIWNEPNLEEFWHAPPDPVEYARLVSAVAAAIRQVAPRAWIVGPATAGFPWDYIAALAEQGALNQLDAVTVHPYRFSEPESVWEDYVRLRSILDRVSPHRKIPIISGEWGYTTVESGLTEEEQARYLARQWLFNLASDVDLSIWYNWRNGGSDPYVMEHNFGLVREDLTPKLSYEAAQVLIATLDGYSFQRRIPLANLDDYLLLFRNGDQIALAGWTTGNPHTVTLPPFCDTVEVVEMTGETRTVAVGAEGLEIALGPSPRYVRLCASETLLWLALWRPAESIHMVPPDGMGHVLVEVDNPFHEPLQGELQVMAEGKVLGTAPVRVRPGELAKVSVPVAIKSPDVTILPAAVVFLTPDGLPLQSAAIWLHVVQR